MTAETRLEEESGGGDLDGVETDDSRAGSRAVLDGEDLPVHLVAGALARVELVLPHSNMFRPAQSDLTSDGEEDGSGKEWLSEGDVRPKSEAKGG